MDPVKAIIIFIGVIFVILGVILLPLYFRGKPVKATIVNRSMYATYKRNGKQTVKYIYTVKYTVNGKEFHNSYTLSSFLKEGSTVTIKVKASDPSKIVSVSVGLLIAGVLFLVIGALLCIAALFV
jgi:hypothetical protein